MLCQAIPRNAASMLCAAQLAIAARTTHLKAMFLELSKNWEKLAIQLEDAFARICESEAIRSNVRESLNETRRLFWLAHLEQDRDRLNSSAARQKNCGPSRLRRDTRKMSARGAKRCRDRAEELRVTSD